MLKLTTSLVYHIPYIKTMSKMGRPTNNPKDTTFKIRISSEEMAILEQLAKDENTSKAEIIRKAIKNYRP